MRAQSLIALTLAAGMLCAGPAAGANGPAAGKTVKIGVIADVTGGAGVYGTSQKNAFLLAQDDMARGAIDTRGAKIEFDIEDPATDPNQVVNLVQKFVSDGTVLQIGPTLSSEAQKADPIAVSAGLPVLGTSNTAQGITAMGRCVFRDSLSEEQVVPFTVRRTLQKWHYKTAAVIYGDDDQFTKTDYDIFKDVLSREHITVVDTETYHKKDVDFQAQLTKIAQKKPDVLVLGALAQEAAKIMVQARKLGIKAPIMGGNGLNSPALNKLAGSAANGTVVGAAWFIDNGYTGNKQFVANYKKRFGVAPDQFAAQAYAAAQLVAQVVGAGATTRSEICTALRTLRVANTVIGPIAFESTRDVKGAPVILELGPNGFGYFK